MTRIIPQLRIVPDLFHVIYPYLSLEQYETYNELNKKCYDVIHNHNIIHKYHNDEITFSEFEKYNFDACIHNMKNNFINKLVNDTYEQLFLEYIKQCPKDKNKTSYIHGVYCNGDYKLIIINSYSVCEAVYEAIKLDLVGSYKYFVERLSTPLKENNYDLYESLNDENCFIKSVLRDECEEFGWCNKIYLIKSKIVEL
jgi:hypothetical protein